VSIRWRGVVRLRVLVLRQVSMGAGSGLRAGRLEEEADEEADEEAEEEG
jgi:hypothetical protein